jgi:hypothetical protein
MTRRTYDMGNVKRKASKKIICPICGTLELETEESSMKYKEGYRLDTHCKKGHSSSIHVITGDKLPYKYRGF